MGTPHIRLGILLPTRALLLSNGRPRDAGLLFRMAQRAEEAGLDSVWVGDSLTAKPRLEPLTTLAAVAARTERVRLGTAVLLAALRHPVLLAHVVGTLDLISRGRLVLAVGVGGAFNEDQRREWLAAEVEPVSRASRLEELVSILRRLGRGEELSFSGSHFFLHQVQIEPRPVQEGGVPILWACHLKAGIEAQFRRAAALGDGFISISEPPESYSLIVEKVRTHAEELGKDFSKMEAAFYMTVNLGHDEAGAQEEANRYIADYYGINIWRNLWGPFGPPERCVDRIHQYAAAGARTIIVRFASYQQEEQLETFLKEVWPAFRPP